MSLYLNKLRNEESMPDTRAFDIEEAIDKLHSAIAKCDCRTLKIFWSKSIEDRLREFAKIEELIDITPNNEGCKI